MQLLTHSALMLVSAAFVAALLPSFYSTLFSAFFTFLGSAGTGVSALLILSGATPAFITQLGLPFYSISFSIDQLSAFFLLIISLSSLLSVFGYFHLQSYSGKNPFRLQAIFLPVLILSMCGVVTCTDSLTFILFWEIMSLSSFALIMFEKNSDEVVTAGHTYLVYMQSGMFLILLGFLKAYSATGSFDLLKIADLTGIDRIITAVLLMTGFAIKSGFIPFHGWLPRAYPPAPGHISGIMSGIMSKTGFYGIIRTVIITGIFNRNLAAAFLIISSLTAVYGIILASSESDLKKLLAFSSVENAGLIGIGLASGMLGIVFDVPLLAISGISAAVFHILNHSLFKSLLFCISGLIYQKTGTRKLELLGGLSRLMPFSAVPFFLGSLAICGLPPGNAFYSEFLLLLGLISSSSGNPLLIFFSVLTIYSVAAAGIMAIMCFTKAYGIAFTGIPRTQFSSSTEKFHAPQLIIWTISAVILLIGLFPQFPFQTVLLTAKQITGLSDSIHTQSLSLAVENSSQVIRIATLLFLLLYLFRKKYGGLSDVCTWGCGYSGFSTRIQYTASSYIARFMMLFRPLVKADLIILPPKGEFPDSASFECTPADPVNRMISNPLSGIMRFLADKLDWLQSGSTTQYIGYGLLFLMLSLMGAIRSVL